MVILRNLQRTGRFENLCRLLAAFGIGPLEAQLFLTLDLNHPAIVHHQLDRSVAYAPQGAQHLLDQIGRLYSSVLL
ncbi:MAG: hypothetical protein ACREYE_10330 [Gammaproteobacteria bacterium]